MRPYLAVLSARIRMLLQYRAAALAGMSTQLFWGLIRVMIFEAFYRTATQAQPMTYAEVVNYVWLGQALFALLPWTPDNDVRTMVRTGTVAYELVRPIDLYAFWYSRALANRIAPTLLRSAPLFCLALLFFGLQAPASPAAAAAWALAMVGAVLLGGALSNLVNVSLLWTIAGEGTIQMLGICIYVFSGMVIPLPLFPDVFQPILDFMPFRGLADTPFRLYMGHIPASQVWSVVGHQLAWTLALVGLGRFLLIAFALCDAFSRGFDQFASTVKSGDFDRLLLRPRSTALQLAGQELTLKRIGRLIQGLVVLLWASHALDLAWTPDKLLLALLTVLGGACLFYGLIVLQATLAFWTTESLEIFSTVTYGGVETAQYPLAIYRAWFRRFFTYVIPLACVSYYPALGILERPDPLGSGPLFQWLAPTVGLLFFVICLQVWQVGVRHYRSTGS